MCEHEWKEIYNGIKCIKCDMFYPDNGNYFADIDDGDEFAESELTNEEMEDELE